MFAQISDGIENLIVDNDVVSRTGGAVDSSVSLQKKVPGTGICDVAIDHGAVLGVGGPICVFGLGGVEARMVAFTHERDEDFW